MCIRDRVYAGMTGQSLVSELSGVLNGGGLVKGAPAPDTVTVDSGTAGGLASTRASQVPPFTTTVTVDSSTAGGLASTYASQVPTTPNSGPRYPLVLPPAAPR